MSECYLFAKSRQDLVVLFNSSSIYCQLLHIFIVSSLYLLVGICNRIFFASFACTAPHNKTCLFCLKAPRGLQNWPTDKSWVSFEKFRKGPNTIPFSAKYWKAYIIFTREWPHHARRPHKPKGGMRNSHHHHFMIMTLIGENLNHFAISLTDRREMNGRQS